MLRWLPLLVFLPVSVFASSGENAGHGLIGAVGWSVIAATLVGGLAHLTRQPLLLAYIVAGVLIGPKIGLGLVPTQVEVETISEIGLVLLLFMIGLELDLRKLLDSGRTLILSGLLQFVLCVALGLLFFSFLGFPLGQGHWDRAYLAVAMALSSTAIVVKLLYSKFELDTLAGRITLGVLVFQDVWAIVVLGIQPNLAHPEVLGILGSFAKGGTLVLLSFLASRYVLQGIFRGIAKQPELVLIASLGWCFLVCAMASAFGLSMEMGALIAGAAISTFPYNIDVVAKIVSIRDFFVTLFFVALGMKIPSPMGDPGLLGLAFVGAAFVIGSRLISLSPLLGWLGGGHRVSLLVPINLAQVSEFSLVIVSLGYGLGHVSERTLSLVLYTFVITAVASTYLIQYSHPVQRFLSRLLSAVGLKDMGAVEEQAAGEVPVDVALLGFHRTASALVAELEDQASHGNEDARKLLQGLVVVDFNPQVHAVLRDKGIRAVYGDVAHLDTLHHAGVQEARIVASTIPDTLLKGTDNHKLLLQLRRTCPHSLVLVTAEGQAQTQRLYDDGADFVLQPHRLEAARLSEFLFLARTGAAREIRERERKDFMRGHEILQ